MKFDDGCRCRRMRDEYFVMLDPQKKPLLRCRNLVRFPLSILLNKPVMEDAAGKPLCYIDHPIFCSPVFTLRLPDGRTELVDTSVSARCGLDRADYTYRIALLGASLTIRKYHLHSVQVEHPEHYQLARAVGCYICYVERREDRRNHPIFGD
ncbi:MAG: hypothetical protein IJ498_06300 [Akkermansia sp.]|nr:hypothetical protein [Akkermansia sp.]